nr:SOS response-associated peptidase family protein [Maribacter sp. Hal144]
MFFERKDKEIINLAGIYGFTNDGHATFAILTKPATPLFEKIHNTKKRRPVILHDGQIDGWLDNSAQRNDIENLIAGDMPDENISAYPISKDLYSPKADSNRPDISEVIHYQEVAIDYEGKPPTDLFG